MTWRPIREIVNTRALRPTGKGAVVRDRRTSDRFTCRLPAVLESAGREYPVECQEISSTGVRVTSQRPLAVTADQPVVIKLRVGSQHFSDRFRVVRATHHRAGPITIHLALEAPQTAGAAEP